MATNPMPNEDCPESPDGTHCVHWYDEEDMPCCYCGDNTPNPATDQEE